MEKLTSGVKRIYLNRIVTPVIIQSKKRSFDDLRNELLNEVPVSFRNPLPRIIRGVVPALSRWKEIPTFNMIGTALTANLIERAAQMRSVERIYVDDLRYALQSPSVPVQGIFKDFQGEPFTSTFWTKNLLGLDTAHAKGFTGRGVKLAVLDTGTRVDLPQVRRTKVLTAMPEKGGTGLDSNGHGTWCTSCAGGRAAIDPRYNAPVVGMAPESDLFSIQVLGFVIGMGTISDILKGMQMALERGIKVVSMSLGSENPPADKDNPELVAVNTLTENGTIVVVAAGNSGPGDETIGSPGSINNSLTVGAVNPLTGELAKFSSRGPTRGDRFTKPDLVSYGVRIDSQSAGLLDDMIDPTQLKYVPISGTSMATPHVAGLVADMAQLYAQKVPKNLTTSEIKKMMASAGKSKNNQEGWGLLTWDIVENWVSTQYGVTV